MNELQHEWAIIHSDIEKYERLSLVIKLFCVLVSVISIGYLVDVYFTVAIILVLWLQDGIWKTFQKRLEARIVFVEQKLLDEADNASVAFQLYTQWEDKRQGVVGLIKEYIVNAIKPTVAYPYPLLVVLVLFFYQ